MSRRDARWRKSEPSDASKGSYNSICEHSRKYTGIFAGVILVAMGVILMLNVLGILKFSIWQSFSMYWPIGLILIGIAIILRLRWLTVTFVILTVVLCTSFFASGIFSPIHGSGNTISKNYDVPAFENINIDVPAKVYLTQGAPGSAVNVTVVGDDNVIEIVKAEVTGNTLSIRYAGDFNFWNVWNDKDLEIYITAPDMKSISIDGAGSLESTNQIVADDLKVELSGAADIDMNVSVNSLTTEVSGFSDMTLEGTAKNYSASISGASDIKAYDLVVSDAKVHISGSGDLKLNVVDTLDVDISGAGDVKYRGNPKVTQRVSGAGDIKKDD